MVGLDFLTAFVITVFYFLVGTVPVVPLFIVTLMLLYGISGTYQPAVQASIPALVPKDRILWAGAIVNQVGSLANFIGPVIGGMLYGFWGIGSILRVSILCFILSAMMEIFIVIPFRGRPAEKRILRVVKEDMKESIWFLRKKKPVFIRICFMIAGLNLFLSSMITIGIPVIIVERLSMADQLLGVSQGLLAVGGMIGGLCTVVFAKILRPGKAWFFILLCAFSVCVMGGGMLLAKQLRFLKYLILSGTGLLVMVFSTMFSIQMLAVVQTQTPTELTGKVVACIMAFIMCAQPAGQLLYGLLFEKISVETPFIMVGTGAVSFFIALYAKKILKELGGEGDNA